MAVTRLFRLLAAGVMVVSTPFTVNVKFVPGLIFCPDGSVTRICAFLLRVLVAAPRLVTSIL